MGILLAYHHNHFLLFLFKFPHFLIPNTHTAPLSLYVSRIQLQRAERFSATRSTKLDVSSFLVRCRSSPAPHISTYSCNCPQTHRPPRLTFLHFPQFPQKLLLYGSSSSILTFFSLFLSFPFLFLNSPLLLFAPLSHQNHHKKHKQHHIFIRWPQPLS